MSDLTSKKISEYAAPVKETTEKVANIDVKDEGDEYNEELVGERLFQVYKRRSENGEPWSDREIEALMDDDFFSKYVKTHIRDTLRQIDENNWLAGNLLIHREENGGDKSQTKSGATEVLATWYDDEENSTYSIEEAPTPLPALSNDSSDRYVKQIHDMADASAVWAIGSKVILKTRFYYPKDNVTPEDVTLKWLSQKNWNFQIPRVIYSTIHDRVSLLFMTRIPGQTLGDTWRTLSADRRQFYVTLIADAYESMAEWKGDSISGIDGKYLSDHFLEDNTSTREYGPQDFRSEVLERNCRIHLNLDCSSFVFNHADLGPTNIIIDGDNVGLIDWETAGYVPRDWITTKIAVSGGFVLPEDTNPEETILEYKRAIVSELGKRDFSPPHIDEFCVWRGIERRAPSS